MQWRVEILNRIVEAELDAFPADVKANLLKIVQRIESLGLEQVDEPYAKHIENKIWELRPHGRNLAG